MYPKDTFPAILAHTSAKLRSLHKPERTKGECWRWLGIRVVMVLEPRKGAITVYWETVPRPFTVYLTGKQYPPAGLSADRLAGWDGTGPC